MVSPAYLPPEMLMATRNEGASYDGAVTVSPHMLMPWCTHQAVP